MIKWHPSPVPIKGQASLSLIEIKRGMKFTEGREEEGMGAVFTLPYYITDNPELERFKIYPPCSRDAKSLTKNLPICPNFCVF